MESGFLFIDKPVDWTSHDVVAYLRGVTKIKKIGHAGTLDPFATGLLIVGVGRAATKRLDEWKGLQKTYVADIYLGATSTTQDCTGEISIQNISIPPSQEQVTQVLSSYIGKQQQIPPMYSAKKIGGKKLYDLARKGEEVERQANNIEIYSLRQISYTWPILSIETTVSVGTYIRTLAHDIGQDLAVGGYCDTLRRTTIGEYTVDEAYQPKQIGKDNWQSHLRSL